MVQQVLLIAQDNRKAPFVCRFAGLKRIHESTASKQLLR
jgi:hypothetical protein